VVSRYSTVAFSVNDMGDWRDKVHYRHVGAHSIPALPRPQKISMTLDELYKMIAYVYSEQNAQRSNSATFAHFVEVCGMLTIHDRKKKREGVTVTDALCKALGWYFPLLAKFRVRSVEDLVFRKYPYVCPYCRRAPHEDSDCKAVRGTSSTVNHDALRAAYIRNSPLRPKSLNEWQTMFQKIYPRGPEDKRSVIGLFEEIGELAEAIRVFEPHPEYFAGEAADVFSYLMGVANELGIRMLQEDNAEFSLQDEFLKRYPGLCTQCGSQICICPSVPQATVGRLAKELGLQTMSELFNPEPRSFAADGKRIAAAALERAGGYHGLAVQLPFDRGDANRALMVLCLKLGDFYRESNPDLADRFCSAALKVGTSETTPGTRARKTELGELPQWIKIAWRELDPETKKEFAVQEALAAEFGTAFGTLRILFVSCSPEDLEHLRGDREYRAIDEAIRLANRGTDISVRYLPASTIDDLRRALLHESYEIIHFSGHSNGNSLVFEDTDGRSQEVPLDAIAELVSEQKDLRCVVLNSCESTSKLSTPMAGHTVGMSDSVDDAAAIEFGRGFYDALACGKNVEDAANEGLRAARLKQLDVPITVLKR
jgi:NTP pyrophosphatase (non-canonical NTP hydrolase)